MKISRVETLRTAVQPNVCVVRLTSDDGEVGLGETFYAATAVEAYIHDALAQILLGMDNASPLQARRNLCSYVGYQGSGVETRAASAIDIALWDLLARRADMPLREILGGPLHDSMPVYNTCAGSKYVNFESRQSSSNWGIAAGNHNGEFEDLWAFINQPGSLAKELVAAGYPGIKVWPFDLAAEASGGGEYADLNDGLRILDAIREAVGDDLKLYIELHGLWTLRGARRLLRSVAEFNPTWIEDPIRPDSVEALTKLKQDSDVCIATGETLAGARGFLPLLERGAMDIALVDLGWTGGLSAAVEIADAAERYGVPVAPHDCAGPITLMAGLHWVTTRQEGLVQEISRAFYHGWYRHIVDELPPLVDGRLRPLDGAGLGLELSRQFLTAPTTTIRVSA